MERMGTTRTVHPILQWIRGMCSDELPHTEIDAKVAEAVEIAKDLEFAQRKTLDALEGLLAAFTPRYAVRRGPYPATPEAAITEAETILALFATGEADNG